MNKLFHYLLCLVSENAYVANINVIEDKFC